MALSTATDLGLEVHEVPTEPAAILNHAFDRHNRNKEPKSIIGSLTVQLIRKKVEITQEQRQWVFDILQSLSKIAFFTAKVEEMLEIKFILLALMGEWKKASGPYAFPDPFPNDAAIILARVQNDLGFEDAMEPTPSPSPSLSPPPIPDSKKRKRPQETPTPRLSAPRRPVNMNETTIKALMRNITISDESSRRSYKLTDKSQKVDCDVVGDNGLKVGRWWPFRICALRDGAHGAMQGGIAGGATGGTYSIVVSRAYEGLDKDEGNVILYSGSNSHDNKDPEIPVLTHATKGMQLAHHQRRSVRVLRTAGSPWNGAPRVGIRYDGLYTIVEEMTLENRKGGAYMAFKLVRNEGQPEIVTSRPTQVEKAAFDRLKESV